MFPCIAAETGCFNSPALASGCQCSGYVIQLMMGEAGKKKEKEGLDLASSYRPLYLSSAWIHVMATYTANPINV